MYEEAHDIRVKRCEIRTEYVSSELSRAHLVAESFTKGWKGAFSFITGAMDHKEQSLDLYGLQILAGATQETRACDHTQRPPSTSKLMPVMNSASSLPRYAQAFATSCGVELRPSGIVAINGFSFSFLPRNKSVLKSVSQHNISRAY